MTKVEVEELQTIISQLHVHHTEFAALSSKKPNEPLNPFKLGVVNKTFARCNKMLSKSERPFDDFELFDSNQIPSNSDVVLMLAQYQVAIERLRASNIRYASGSWCFKMSDSDDVISTLPPRRG